MVDQFPVVVLRADNSLGKLVDLRVRDRCGSRWRGTALRWIGGHEPVRPASLLEKLGPDDTSGAGLKFYRRQAACGKRKQLAIPSFSIGDDKDPRASGSGRGAGQLRASPRVSRSPGQRRRCGGIARWSMEARHLPDTDETIQDAPCNREPSRTSSASDPRWNK